MTDRKQINIKLDDAIETDLSMAVTVLEAARWRPSNPDFSGYSRTTVAREALRIGLQRMLIDAVFPEFELSERTKFAEVFAWQEARVRAHAWQEDLQADRFAPRPQLRAGAVEALRGLRPRELTDPQ